MAKDFNYIAMSDTLESNNNVNPIEIEQQLVSDPVKHVTWSQIIGGSIGNILEWYDFATFGFLATEIGNAFFPSGSTTAELIQAYGVFSGAFVARPIGGVVFGIVGDRYGRKLALQISMAMMFISTFLMGCLPTYHNIGMMSPVILTLLRLVQGFSVGGQLVGSILFLVESSNPKKRGFYGALVMMTATVGTMFGAWVVSIFEGILSEDDMNNWGWRIPFLLSFIIGIFGFYTQYKMDGSHEFAASSHKVLTNPFKKAVLIYWKQIILITLVVTPWSAGFYLIFLWLPTYLENERKPSVEHGFVVNSFMFIWICTCLLIGGYVCDKLNGDYFKQMKISSALMILVFIPLFLFINLATVNGDYYPFIITQFILGILLGLYAGPMEVFMVDCIDDVVVRMCVIGAGYNLCQALFGGTAPVIATALSDGASLTYVGVYMAGLSLFGFIMVLVRSKQAQNGRKQMIL